MYDIYYIYYLICITKDNEMNANTTTMYIPSECTKSEVTGNSCVYVSLKQRIPAYGKFAFSINLGASEYAQLGKILRSSNPNWNEAAKLVDPGFETKMPSPTVDALLKWHYSQRKC